MSAPLSIRTGVRTRRNALAVIGVVLVPLTVVGLLLWGLWSPQERLDTVRAAIVNADEPVTVDGQIVPLGRQLAAALVGSDAAANYTWEITDQDDAASGLEGGRYVAVVTIPEDFSAAATSFSGDVSEARQATIDVRTADDGRVVDDAISRAITATAATVLGQQLTQTYLDNVLVGFSTLHDQLGTAADGAVSLADGLAALQAGNGQLADGAAQLASGAGDAADGAAQLATGVRQSATGAGQVATGASDLAAGTSALADGAEQLAGGLATLRQSTTGLPAQAAALASGSQQVADGLAQYVGALTAQQTTVCGAAGAADPTCQALTAQITQLAPLLDGAQQAAAGTAALAGDASPGAGLAGLADGIAQLAGSPASGSTPASGAQALAQGAAAASTGADQLAAGATALRNGLQQLDRGAATLSAGTGQLAGGAGDLADALGEAGSGVDQLAGGGAELADGLGSAVDQVPAYTDSERASLAAVVAQPVTTPGLMGSGSFGTGPAVGIVALWLGALATFFVFRSMPTRVLGSTRSALSMTLRTLVAPAGLAGVQGGAVGVVLGVTLDASGGELAGLVLVGALAALAFTALNQALVVLAGNLGRVLSLLIGLLVLVTAVIATVPDVLVAVRDVLPVGAGVDALAAVLNGAGGLGGAVAVLVAWTAASIAATSLAVAGARKARAHDLVAAHA